MVSLIFSGEAFQVFVLPFRICYRRSVVDVRIRPDPSSRSTHHREDSRCWQSDCSWSGQVSSPNRGLYNQHPRILPNKMHTETEMHRQTVFCGNRKMHQT